MTPKVRNVSSRTFSAGRSIVNQQPMMAKRVSNNRNAPPTTAARAAATAEQRAEPSLISLKSVGVSKVQYVYVCAGCNKPIKRDKYLLKACDQYWHENCLRCDKCHTRLGELGSTLYNKSNMNLCRQDYLEMFGQTGICSVCNKLICASEMVMRAKKNVYHLECFACQLCSQRFCVGDRFYLCDNKIVCQYDYEELYGPSAEAYSTVMLPSAAPVSSATATSAPAPTTATTTTAATPLQSSGTKLTQCDDTTKDSQEPHLTALVTSTSLTSSARPTPASGKLSSRLDEAHKARDALEAAAASASASTFGRSLLTISESATCAPVGSAE